MPTRQGENQITTINLTKNLKVEILFPILVQVD